MECLFFDLEENLKINENETNNNLFEIINNFEIPFSFKFQVYNGFKKLYENEKNNSKITRNIKILRKCINEIYTNKMEKQKFLKNKEEKRKGYENYIKIVNSIKENNYYCYKPNQDNNNYIISFINDSKKFLKNQERNLLSNYCLKYDNSGLYAIGSYKKIFLKSHITPKNINEEKVRNCYLTLWNDYMDQEIKREKIMHELDELYGKDEYGKKLYLQRNFLILNQLEIQKEEYNSRLRFKEKNQEA